MRLSLLTLFVSFALAGACAQFPELDQRITPELADAAPPDLIPLAPLIARAEASQAGAAVVETDLDPRLAALRARADRLRGPVIPPRLRAQMLRGVR